jgi:hypothetical protein
MSPGAPGQSEKHGEIPYQHKKQGWGRDSSSMAPTPVSPKIIVTTTICSKQKTTTKQKAR